MYAPLSGFLIRIGVVNDDAESALQVLLSDRYAPLPRLELILQVAATADFASHDQ